MIDQPNPNPNPNPNPTANPLYLANHWIYEMRKVEQYLNALSRECVQLVELYDENNGTIGVFCNVKSNPARHASYKLFMVIFNLWCIALRQSYPNAVSYYCGTEFSWFVSPSAKAAWITKMLQHTDPLVNHARNLKSC